MRTVSVFVLFFFFVSFQVWTPAAVKTGEKDQDEDKSIFSVGQLVPGSQSDSDGSEEVSEGQITTRIDPGQLIMRSFCFWWRMSRVFVCEIQTNTEHVHRAERSGPEFCLSGAQAQFENKIK